MFNEVTLMLKLKIKISDVVKHFVLFQGAVTAMQTSTLI